MSNLHLAFLHTSPSEGADAGFRGQKVHDWQHNNYLLALRQTLALLRGISATGPRDLGFVPAGPSNMTIIKHNTDSFVSIFLSFYFVIRR